MNSNENTTKTDKLAKARAARKSKRGTKQPNLIKKAQNNPKSKKMAIDAMCYSCQGGTESSRPDTGWDWSIGNCTVTDCPLYPHRPYQGKEGNAPKGVYK